MSPEYVGGNVRTACPDCKGALSVYFSQPPEGREYGSFARNFAHIHKGQGYSRIVYRFLKCGGCGRGGVAEVHCGDRVEAGVLGEFYPASRDFAPLPDGTPGGVVLEYREAELCASVGAMRGASVLLRSALEKTLRANGYLKGTLEKRIDEATDDRILTQARQKSAHEDVRVFGNDILHEDWRPVDPEEYEAAHRYVQPIIEDFYDQRDQVEAVLVAADRIKPKNTEQTGEVEGQS